MENFSEKQHFESNPIKDLLLFIRKMRLLYKIGRANKRAKSGSVRLAKEKAQFQKKWNRRKRYRLLKIAVKRSLKNFFKQETGTPSTTVPQAVLTDFHGNPQKKQSVWYRRRRRISFIVRRLLKGWKSGQRIRKRGLVPSYTKIPDGTEKLVIAFNSTVYLLLAYFTFQIINQFLTALIAHQFGFSVVLTYHGIWYNVARTDWTGDSVKTLFSIQPVTGLFLGLASLYVYYRVKQYEGLLKLFFLWAFMFGFNAFFGGLFIGSLFSKGFGHVLIWFYFMDTAKLVVSLTSLTVLLLVGSFTRNFFLYSANTYFSELNNHNVRHFVNAQFVYPFFIGISILFLFKLPDIEIYEGFLLITPLLIILPLFVYPNLECEYFFDNANAGYRLRLKLLVATLLLLVLYRIVFEVFTIGFSQSVSN
jgi:hypothetical protein